MKKRMKRLMKAVLKELRKLGMKKAEIRAALAKPIRPMVSDLSDVIRKRIPTTKDS
jgi:hypothetical protein